MVMKKFPLKNRLLTKEELEWNEILNRVKEIDKKMKSIGVNIVTRDIFIPNKKKEEYNNFVSIYHKN